ncbi:MAG: tRNA guanosine(34) transglycosylase Tgt [Candidatus Paceibacterota bacterium]
MTDFSFKIEAKIPGRLGRAGIINTPHGPMATPAFIVVGTKAAVKAVLPEQVAEVGAEAVLANTYHLYLAPGSETVKAAGGLHRFMNWPGPMMTDSGGFQVFSLGAAFGQGGINKFNQGRSIEKNQVMAPLARIDEEGVTFKSHLDGKLCRLTPEISMKVQHDLGADIIFAFDECTTPQAEYDYQVKALDRTHRWAKESLAWHRRLGGPQALFGIVQGGRYNDLRRQSAEFIASLGFAGYGIGGSFDKEDIAASLQLVNSILPESAPRHLLGIGEIVDLFAGIEEGIDTFDCVTPTRLGRHGALQTAGGRLNLFKAEYRQDFSSPVTGCLCYTCRHYSRAYLSHLFRAGEMAAATLASIHNIYFFVNLVKDIRRSILDGDYRRFKQKTLAKLKVN